MGPLPASIAARHRELLRVLGVDAPLHVSAQHDGSAHVECRGSRYWYVRTERGNECERRETESVDELLYWLMQDVTFQLASDFEVRHRRSGEDVRRQLFAKQEELLGSLSPSWAERLRQRHQAILEEHPFVDGR